MGDYPHWQHAIAAIIVQPVTDVFARLIDSLSLWLFGAVVTSLITSTQLVMSPWVSKMSTSLA